MQSCVYFGSVMHQRLKPFRHRFRYRIFTLLLDLDELPALRRKTGIMSYNRFNIFGIYDRDHATRDGRPMKQWVMEKAVARGTDLSGGKIYMLCFPRLFGYVFNPLTVYFCQNSAGKLVAILYEVKNTFGDQHGYFLPVEYKGQEIVQHAAMKIFHVSPFIDVAGSYHFTLREPGEKLALMIRHKDAEGDLLLATWNGKRAALGTANLLKALFLFPFQAFYVVFAIHWQALRIWLKGGKYYSYPEPPHEDVS